MQCSHPIQLKSGLLAPCGKCPQCRANERQEWVFRLQQEFKACAFGLFVTLTYDDDHLPLDGVQKIDIQKFLKRLRKHFPPADVRYYLVSEYGDHTHRPHYHGLFFFKNKPLDKRVVYDTFEKSWNQGFLSFGDIEEGSIVYCTKYCLKKCYVPEGQNAVFRLMSKMNGCIGSDYIDRMKGYHIDRFDYLSVYDNGKRCRMPRTYRDKIFSKHNPLVMNLKQKVSDRLDQEQYNKQQNDMLDFFKANKFESSEAAIKAWIDYLNGRKDRKSDLIMKHNKKQVM